MQSLMGNTDSLSIDTARFNHLGPIIHIQALPNDLHQSTLLGLISPNDSCLMLSDENECWQTMI